MKHMTTRTISFLLTLALLLQLLPASIFATEEDQTANEALTETEYLADGEELQNAEILFEEESLREENVKHFRMEDGTYMAVRYDAPVHYRDESGAWLEYDNTLTPVSTLDSGGISFYRVENGDSLRIFAANANAASLLTLQKGDFSLSFAPVQNTVLPADGNQPVVASVAENEIVTACVLETASVGDVVEDPLLAQTQPDKFYSALEYENTLKGATLRYENYGRTVKESIVIPAPQENYSYSFQIEASGLVAALREDGIVTFAADSGEVVYYIPAPYMIDADNAVSFDADYTLEGRDGSYILTVTADTAWMNDTDRAFPVVLDPTITEGDLADEKVTATIISSGYPGGQTSDASGLYVGNNGNGNQMVHTLVHVNQLIEIPDGSEITCATFSLAQFMYERQSGGLTSLDIGLYPMYSLNGETNYDIPTSRWQNLMNVVTWSAVYGSGAYYIFDEDTPITDAATVSSVTQTTSVTWDITLLARQWYADAGNNLGFILRPLLPANQVTARASFYGPDAGNGARPQLTVSYRNTVGVEPQYSYQIAGIARAGTAYISDATLHQTTVVPLLASASEVMPFSLSLVYNSVYGNRVFKQDSTMLHTKPFTNMNLGAGWKLSAQESVCFLTVDSTTFLIYTDADGTEHYFRKLSGSTYQDEDGLGLKITVSGSDFTMTDDYGNTKFFGNGYLKQQYDAYGNYLYFNYNGDAQLSTIKRRNKDSTVEETLASFTYNASTKRLTSITDEAGRTLSLTYTTLGSTYSLSRIQFADGAKMQYTYSACADGAYRMATAYDAEAGYGMEFGYAAGGVINSFAEYVGTSKAYGAKFSAEKLSHNQTQYCYYGKDGTKGGTDDIYTHKVLDTLGRTINSYSTDYTQKHVLGVGVSNYKTNSGTSKQNNRLTANASAGQQGVNLLKNASVENSSVGINANYGWSSIGNAALDTNAYLGEVSLCFNRSTASSTVDQWYQEVTLEAGKAYTFSAYVNVPKSVSFSDGGGIYLAFQNSSGNCLKTGETLNYSTADMNGGWVRLTVTYTNNATAAVNLRAAVCADHYTGSIYADAMQLEEEDAASTFNLVEDGSFEHTVTIADSSSYYWYKTGTADVTDTEATYFGTKTLRLSGEGGYQRISRDISVNAPLDSTFILSAWAKAAATPKSGATQGISESELSSYFGLILRFYYSDGSSEAHYYPFDPYYRDWQYVQGIAVPQKTGSATIESITIVAAYEGNINSAYIDNISFRMEPVQTYTYDENGNLKTAAQTGTGTASATYDGVDLTQYTAANQNKYTYTYNNAHDVLTTTVDGVTATNTYSTAGNILTSVLSNSTNSLIIKSSATATTDKNHTASVTDANGNKTTYTYDSGTEQLTSVKNAKNVTTTYTYDTAGRTTKVEHPKASIRYFYQNGQLSTLGRTTQNAAGSNVYQGYTFETNAWGQITAVNIATSANGTTWTDQIELASYTYNNCGTGRNGGGNLAQMTYGNGDTVSYTYDDLDRLTRRSYNDGRYVIYEYNAEGQLAQLTYGDNGMEDMTFAFEYDSLGRLIRSTQSDSDNLYQRTEHIYDSYGRLSKQSWIIGGRSYSESYTYDDGADGDGSLKTMRTGTGDIRSYTYDTLKRLQKVTVTNGGTEILSTAYAYRDISATQTTPQVQYRNVRDAYGTIIEGKKYEYDALGNITKISQSESPYQPLIVYHYDSQNQLISEIYYDGNGSATTNITVAYYYNYDTAGNLLTVQEGKVDANGSLTKTVIQSYTYSNGAWKDLLTSVTVDGTVYNISYDGSGNPETYGNWEFSWQRGRQLCTAGTSTDTTDTNLSYAYDADGIRTSKRYTVSTYEDIPQYTVTFKADGVTVKTMTVEDGYVLQTGDYPAVPAKTGYTGAWQQYNAEIHADVTVQAVYTILQYTVRFVINSATVKIMTVNYGYVLQESDYPEIPPRAGLVGYWRKYTAPICENVTIPAAYCAAYHTVTFSVPGSSFLHSPATVVKEMTVSDGYKLVASDYPPVPPRSGYSGSWRQFTEEIHSDISISAIYEVVPTIPVQPTNPPAIMSVDDPDDIVEEPNNELTASVYTAVSSDAVRTEVAATAGSNAVTDSIREGQVLVSTQTVQHDYVTQNGKVVRETVRTNGTVTAVMDFIYDESGRPFALKYSSNGGSTFATYYYILNLQGDVVKLVQILASPSGIQEYSEVASYTYDAWGNILSSTGNMADINPLRYRGYYYDTETGFYYLQSRYYDPVTHRFINADSFSTTDIDSVLASNMFAYCENNPVLRIDSSGEFFFTIIGAAVGAVCGAVEAAIKGEDILAGAASGAVSGAITGAAADLIAVTGGTAVVAVGVMAGAGALGALAENATNSAITGDPINWKETGKDMFWGAAFGGLFGYMGGNVPSRMGKVADRGLMTVLIEPLQGGVKNWSAAIAEETLSNATADVGRFTAKYIRTIVSDTFK